MAKKETDTAKNLQQPVQMKPEDLKALHQKMVEEKKRVIEDLNKFAYPIQATVFMKDQKFTFRNKAFWMEFKRRDDMVVDFMEKFLSDNE